MKFFAIAAVLGLATPAFSSTNTYNLTYDSKFDKGNSSLNSVACSTGEYGLLTHGFKVLKDLPTYPSVGGAPHIKSRDSSYCGTCWQLTYTDGHNTPKRLNFTAINTGGRGSDEFTISLESFKLLTGGDGKELKRVPITVDRKPYSWCNLEF